MGQRVCLGVTGPARRTGRLPRVRCCPLPTAGTDDAPRGHPASPPATAACGRPRAQPAGRGGPERGERPTGRAGPRHRRWAVIVGALMVATVWIVATGGPFGRTQTPTAPSPATGSTVPPASEPAIIDVPPPWEQVDITGLPPAGAVPSTPKTGNLVAQFTESQVGRVYVYADGRVIWYRVGSSMFERRLTPDGVDLVRSGAVHPGGFLTSSQVPASAWADPEIRAYVPATYAVCHGGRHRLLEASRVVGQLPAPAKACSAARNGRTTLSSNPRENPTLRHPTPSFSQRNAPK